MNTDIYTYILSFVDANRLWLGILLGWMFTRIIALFQKASVSFELSNDVEFSRNGKTFKFLNLVVNKRPNPFKQFIFTQTNINNGRAWIIFKDYISKIEMLKINARWASTREPIDYNSGQPLIPEILLPSRDFLPVGESATISVAIKEKTEKSFFAFNNESYLHNWKNQDFELEENKYLLEVRLLADGKEYKQEFLLTNPSKSLKNFKLTKK